jgi:hypothetical protein
MFVIFSYFFNVYLILLQLLSYFQWFGCLFVNNKESEVLFMWYWIIKVFVAGVVVTIVTVYTIDLNAGSSMAALMTNNLPSGSYTVVTNSPYAAPEIDAASGTSAIALLTGVLLLAGERSWSKRSSKSEE